MINPHAPTSGSSIIAADPALNALQGCYLARPVSFLPELPNTRISLTRWRRTEIGPSHLIRHPQSFYTLSLILRPMRARAWFSSALIWSGQVGANMVRLTPPGLEPSWQSEGEFDFLLFTIPAQTIDRMAGESAPQVHAALRQCFPLYGRDEVVLQLARNMLAVADSQRTFALQFADGLAFSLVAHLLDRYVAGPSRAKYVGMSPYGLQRVRQYIADHLAEPVSVEELSSVAGLSSSHFAHSFRASTGVPPHQFVRNMRIERARMLLQETDQSIATIAVDCGFKDASHFARVFREITGTSPKQFRFRS